ncbi:MAG: CHAT domain-containing protein [Coleofasciculaceae cyanobacterium SM2_1_6]|nr:CHAT domain-containing protein [Coleofasciculaceae cyanobacterium SM2_1_6]
MANLSYATPESAYISQLIGEPLHRIGDESATRETVIAALQQSCKIFHFTGHGNYNFQQPVKSALYLSQKDRLTIEDIVKIPLDGCELVCLSACETGITGKQAILDEYVGLVSAFLAQGVGCVVSTIWQVTSESSSIAMIEFYRRHYHPKNPQDKITALQTTIDWLRTVTVSDLIAWWADLKTELCQGSKIIDNLERIGIEEDIDELIENTLANQEPTFQPYSHPYYWATFTITGG